MPKGLPTCKICNFIARVTERKRCSLDRAAISFMDGAGPPFTRSMHLAGMSDGYGWHFPEVAVFSQKVRSWEQSRHDSWSSKCPFLTLNGQTGLTSSCEIKLFDKLQTGRRQ